MFRSILVPLDGSVFAEHALPLAVAVAKHCGATLRLLRVVPPLSDYYFLPPMPTEPLYEELRHSHRHDALGYLEKMVNRLEGAVPVICDITDEVEGVSEAICADIVRAGADLVVVSSHGRGAVARFWLGSIADKLVRTAPVPVLMARPPEHMLTSGLHHPVTLKHFLLALSGDVAAERIVEPALAIGKAVNAAYTLVRVVRPAFPFLYSPSGGGAEPAPASSGLTKIDERNCRKAEEYLGAVADRLRAQGATVHTRVPVAEQPAAAILQEATSSGADLIALETHGRGASRVLFGSVADKVVRGSSLPVLICRLPQDV